MKPLNKTGTVAWSPNEALLAVGTVAGALDLNFSSKTELELYDYSRGSLTRVAGLTASVRFNRLSWGSAGIIAAGKENGEIELWKAEQVIANKEKEALLFRGANHSGAVRGLHFNHLQPNQLASGGPDGEILIWDLNQLTKPFAPGPKSQRLEDVTVLSWNRQVPHILAAGSTNGFTVVWDLRHRKELLKLPYPGGRHRITSVAWNPDAPTQMVTSSDDDANPVILMWDLRNASAPEKTLSGHTKGVLCVDWCPKDSDLLLSCGKDNRTIVWNATHGQVIGDLVHTSNWAFESKWCPRNPDLTVVASFDGKIGIHSISNAEPLESLQSAVPATPLDPNDPFAMVTQPETPLYQEPVNFVLVQPPKWFRRPVGASWGFGGKRVSFSQGTSVSIKCVSLDPELSARIDSLEVCLASESLEACSEYCKARAAISSGPDKDIWLFLNTTFSANSQADMLSFLGLDPGFSSDDRLQALMAKLNIAATTPDAHQVAPNDSKAQFSLFHTGKTTEEHDVDNLITKAIISGDFESAVNICLATNRLADALVLALNGGEELLQKAQDEFFKRTSKTRSYIRVLKSIVEQDLSDLVSNIKIEGQGGWREVLALICSFSKPENFAGYFEMFGQRLEGVPSAADRGGELRNHAASMCYIGSANVEKVISLWSVALSLQKQQVASTARSSPSSSILMNQSFVERVQLFFHSIGFVDPELSFVPEEGASFALAPLYTSLAKHAQAAALQGKAYAAWRALEQIPPAFDDIEALDVLRDRVYQSLGKKLGVSGLDPVFPYEVVDVVDIEAQQQLLLQSQGESNRQAASQYGYGAGQPPAFGRQGYQALPQNNAYGAPQGAFGAQSYQQGQYGAPSFQPPRIDTTLQGNYKAAPPFGQPAAAPNYGQSAPAPSFAQPAAAPVVPPFANSSFVQQAPALFQPPSFNAPNIPQYGASANAGPRAVGPPPSTQASQPPPPIPAVADRSKISPKDKPVYLSIKKHWDAYSKTVNSTEKSDIQEAEKRLELLYDQMNSQQVPAPVIDLLSQLGRALDGNDYLSAQRASLAIMTQHFNASGQWIVGIKRLVDGKERLSKPASAAPSGAPQAAGPFAPSTSNSFGAPPPAAVSYGAPPVRRPSGSSNNMGGPPAAGAYGAPPPAASYGAHPSMRPAALPSSNSFAAPPPGNTYGSPPRPYAPPGNSPAGVQAPPATMNSRPMPPPSSSNAYGSLPMTQRPPLAGSTAPNGGIRPSSGSGGGASSQPQFQAPSIGYQSGPPRPTGSYGAPPFSSGQQRPPGPPQNYGAPPPNAGQPQSFANAPVPPPAQNRFAPGVQQQPPIMQQQQYRAPRPQQNQNTFR